jgi:hypothetical protein
MGGCTLGSSGSGQGPVMGPGKHGKFLGFDKVRGREALSI